MPKQLEQNQQMFGIEITVYINMCVRAWKVQCIHKAACQISSLTKVKWGYSDGIVILTTAATN